MIQSTAIVNADRLMSILSLESLPPALPSVATHRDCALDQAADASFPPDSIDHQQWCHIRAQLGQHADRAHDRHDDLIINAWSRTLQSVCSHYCADGFFKKTDVVPFGLQSYRVSQGDVVCISAGLEGWVAASVVAAYFESSGLIERRFMTLDDAESHGLRLMEGAVPLLLPVYRTHSESTRIDSESGECLFEYERLVRPELCYYKLWHLSCFQDAPLAPDCDSLELKVCTKPVTHLNDMNELISLLVVKLSIDIVFVPSLPNYTISHDGTQLSLAPLEMFVDQRAFYAQVWVGVAHLLLLRQSLSTVMPLPCIAEMSIVRMMSSLGLVYQPLYLSRAELGDYSPLDWLEAMLLADSVYVALSSDPQLQVSLSLYHQNVCSQYWDDFRLSMSISGSGDDATVSMEALMQASEPMFIQF
ncbi:hypothetical protein QTV44_002573 [Vibrio vulnificus]|nr:hypothetical protein [Vibrio vulnificus]